VNTLIGTGIAVSVLEDATRTTIPDQQHSLKKRFTLRIEIMIIKNQLLNRVERHVVFTNPFCHSNSIKYKNTSNVPKKSKPTLKN
jgi:hypothetical protein